MEALLLKRDQLDVYETVMIDEAVGLFKQEICHSDLCCDFDIEFKYSRPSSGKVSTTLNIEISLPRYIFTICRITTNLEQPCITATELLTDLPMDWSTLVQS